MNADPHDTPNRPSRPPARRSKPTTWPHRTDPTNTTPERQSRTTGRRCGNGKTGWSPLNQELHLHDLRHTHETWLIEDRVPRIMRLVRLGHKRKDISDIYSHVTEQVIEEH